MNKRASNLPMRQESGGRAMLSLAGLAHDGLSGGLTRRHSFRSISTSLPLEGHVDLLTSVIELVTAIGRP